MICQTFIPDIWHIADKCDYIKSHLFSSSHLIIGTGDENAQNSIILKKSHRNKT